jgi:hypothetical protein
MQASELVNNFVKQACQARAPWTGLKIQDYEAGRAIAGLSAEEQIQVVLEAVNQQVRRTSMAYRGFEERFYLKAVADNLLRRKLPFQKENLRQTLELVSGVGSSFAGFLSLGSILRAVGNYVEDHGLPEMLRSQLARLAETLKAWPSDADTRKAQARIAGLLAYAQGKPQGAPRFKTGEPWTLGLQQVLDKLAPDEAQGWHALLDHCSTATSSKPARKWLKEAETLVAAVGPDRFGEVVRITLAEIGKVGPVPKKLMSGYEFDLDPTMVHDTHSDLLRGLIWCTSLAPSDELIAAVGDAAEICFKKIPGIGPRAPKIGNACLVALSSVSSMAAVGQLSRLKTKAKHASIRKQLGKALDIAAAQTGMSTEELEEVAVPTLGFTEVGSLHQQLGEFTAALELNEHGHFELSWLRSGKKQKTTPATVKSSHAEEMSSLQRTAKEADKLLTAQRHRLEQLLREERSWSYADFQSRYLDHPLMGTLARRLLWRFGESAGAWHDGRLVDERGKVIGGLKETTGASLWHPISAGVEQVQAWRLWFEQHEIRQPFKQTHREVCLLTPAERHTATYSNRFAAHIIRQHQFLALCQDRGWRYQLQGAWDSANTPLLELPNWDLCAEFWVNGVEAGDAGTGFTYLATDQVRFRRVRETEPLPLNQIPPLVFSEVMRDVDLFVGVCSVGNDPQWYDGGPNGQYRSYWHNYSFGDLSATAETRKAVLERLIPRLKIADRCSFADRWLVIRGDLRTYKIHLGSGNILMAPNDQYLCIVPKQTAALGSDRVFLPFEGDTILSVILSKAFLLAEDAKIKDQSIVCQIRRA